MLEKACKLRAENIGVEWDAPSSIRVKQIPESIDFIFDHEPLALYGVLTDAEAIEMKGNVILVYELEGKSHKEKLTFNVEDHNAVEPKYFTLHALAAKDYITQLNQSYDFVSSTVKDSVTQLSRSSGVISKYTSYVAVDESTQDPVQGPLICHDVHDYLEFCSVQTGNCDMIRARRMKRSVLKMPKLKLPGLSVFRGKGSVRNRVLNIASDSSRPDPSRHYERSYARDKYDTTTEDKCKADDDSDSHFGLVNLQSVSGNWTLTKECCAELGKKQQELASAMPEYQTASFKKDEKDLIWATVLAVVWLTSERFKSVQEELCMIIEKAKKWLSNHLSVAAAMDQLVQDAKKTLALTI